MDVSHVDIDDEINSDVVDTLYGHMDRIRCRVIANQVPVSSTSSRTHVSTQQFITQHDYHNSVG
jgi:hypothetical protein